MDGIRQIRISAPNLVNLCIDETDGREGSGRLYCCFREEPVCFQNMHELLRVMQAFMNQLDYPQSSVELRSYTRSGSKRTGANRTLPVPGEEERKRITGMRGLAATLLIYVRYRQLATWQGTVYHIQDGTEEEFRSELELLKIIDRTIAACEICQTDRERKKTDNQ